MINEKIAAIVMSVIYLIACIFGIFAGSYFTSIANTQGSDSGIPFVCPPLNNVFQLASQCFYIFVNDVASVFSGDLDERLKTSIIGYQVLLGISVAGVLAAVLKIVAVVTDHRSILRTQAWILPLALFGALAVLIPPFGFGSSAIGDLQDRIQNSVSSQVKTDTLCTIHFGLSCDLPGFNLSLCTPSTSSNYVANPIQTVGTCADAVSALFSSMMMLSYLGSGLIFGLSIAMLVTASIVSKHLEESEFGAHVEKSLSSPFNTTYVGRL
uniref:Uncharacterized protein n=1 Tax=Palpitomonas bilix TaxID=652834 RepID=A0A7S3GBD7_9EUKA|mmetsp:Transcript_35652/g.92945  ORF Transcript_35652/g.92945 Transcript_35652/m.92945 type:complete len:268 (+) Transcript_35652:42-845(+)